MEFANKPADLFNNILMKNNLESLGIIQLVVIESDGELIKEMQQEDRYKIEIKDSNIINGLYQSHKVIIEQILETNQYLKTNTSNLIIDQ